MRAPKDFPRGMGDKELEDVIKEHVDIVINTDSENVIFQYYPLIILGQHELEKRGNKRITKRTIGISIVSLLVAGVALYLAHTNSRSSENWERQQMEAFAGITKQLENIEKNTKKGVLALETNRQETTKQVQQVGVILKQIEDTLTVIKKIQEQKSNSIPPTKSETPSN